MAAGESAVPRFEDYPAGSIYEGSPAALKLDKPLAQKYADEIQDGITDAHNRANFAGHFIVAKWGCGAPCLRAAIIDAPTGEIFFPPITFEGTGPVSFDLPLLAIGRELPRNPDLEVRPDSDLMIVKATPSQAGKHLSYTFYFLWRQNRWTLLRKVRLPAP
jgi:hypothetical protein